MNAEEELASFRRRVSLAALAVETAMSAIIEAVNAEQPGKDADVAERKLEVARDALDLSAHLMRALKERNES